MELFRSVFQGQVRTLLDKSRGKLEIALDLGLRLKIKIDPSDEETRALAELPWELLYDGETEDFLALSRRTSLVRYLEVPRSPQPIAFTPPLQILAVSAKPSSLHPLDLDKETQYLEALEICSPGIRVRVLPHASTRTVREALSEDVYHILHFMGHGTFDFASGEGMLAFEAADGALDLVSGNAFATKLKDLRSLGVVVLNACNTAGSRHQRDANPFQGVATALVLGGVPAVVAMQRPISDRAAINFSTAFYRHLARGDSIDEAVTEGRQAIHSANTGAFEWATPVLFLRVPDGNVFVTTSEQEPSAASIAASDRLSLGSRSGWALKIAVLVVSVAALLYTQSIRPAVNSTLRTANKLSEIKGEKSQALIAQRISAPTALSAPASPPRSGGAPLVKSSNLSCQAQGRCPQRMRLKSSGDRSSINSCTRREAWAYLKNSQGVLLPVRDTEDTQNDADWLGIRYTNFYYPKIRLGVLQMTDNSAEAEEHDWSGKTDSPLAGIRKMLTVALFNTKRFDVIEQKKIDETEKSQLGNGLAPQYLVYGTVNEWYSDHASQMAGKREVGVAITFVVTDPVTDAVLFMTTEWARLELSSGQNDEMAQQAPVSLAISACANKAAFKIAAALQDQKWTGSVVEVRDSDIYVNAGSQQGMTPDLLLSVYTVKRIVKDIQGRILGEDLEEIGTISVHKIEASFSTAHVARGCEEIRKGDRVELAVKPPQRPIPQGCVEVDPLAP